MNICIPVNEDQGTESRVCEHFGSAPLFMIVDTESGACRAIPNSNAHHGHGMCMPLAALRGEKIDGMAVGGIGKGALSKLRAAGIQVFLSGRPTVGETVAAFQAGTLQQVTPATACGQHHGQHQMQHRGHDDR